MAFTETDRSWIRRYLGTGAIFLQAWPLIENAIGALQSTAEPPGTRPDSSSENALKALVYGLAEVQGVDGVVPGPTPQTTTFSTPAVRGLIQVESAIAFQDQLIGTLEATGEARLDAFRETIRLRMEGRRLANMMARMLGMKRVISDVFSSSSRNDEEPVTMEDLFPAARNW